MTRYTTDVLLVRQNGGELEVMVILRGGELETNKWALPGGHVDPEDAHDFERAAARELFEETNVDVYQRPYPIYLRYAGLREDRSNYWVGHIYWGIVADYHDVSEAKAGDDAKDLKWITKAEFDKMKNSIAFDHADLIENIFTLEPSIF